MKKLWQHISQAYSIVPPHFRKKAKWSLALTLLNGLLDVVSLAALLPVILIFLDPEQITSDQGIGWVYQGLHSPGKLTFQLMILAALVVLFVIKNIISIWVNYFISKTAFDISTALSKRSLQHFFNQSYLEFTQCNSAIVSRKIKTVPHDFASYILIPQLNVISEVIVAGIIITAISLYHPVICILLVVVMFPILLSWKWFKKRHLDQVEDDFRNKYPVSLKYLLQGVDSYIDVKLYQKENFFIEKFIGLKHKMNRNYAYLKTASFMPPKLLEVVLVISVALIFGYSALFNPGLSLIPLLSLFVAGFYRLYPSVTRIINGITTMNAYSYVMEELKTPKVAAQETTKEPVAFEKHIRLEKVSFSYPGKNRLLRQLSLELYRGQCIGISGPSGSGKTTLVKLLTGLIAPDSGHLVIDEKVMTQKCMASWLSKIGYLQQQPVIMDASLEENIAFGEHEINTAKLKEVIRQARLEGFVATLPQGRSTHLGENGLQISGGQRQRIALARALYRNSELLIFDEISNNLDTDNLLEIRASIATLLATGKTVILIDHDPTLLEIADKIWEVSAGQVHETTTSPSLL